MKVQEYMTDEVQVCRPWDSLELAAHLLWKHDCGALPVVDANGRMQSMITDRDICMGALTRGQRLVDLRVADSMSPRLVTCRPDEELSAAAERMRTHAVRRLGVVDEEGIVHGIVSLNDLARKRAPQGPKSKAKVPDKLATEVLKAVSQPGVPQSTHLVEVAAEIGAEKGRNTARSSADA